MWGFVVADGGIKYTRDFCLALAAWAKFAMIWTLLSWTKESVWEIKYDEKWLMYKVNYWMASSKAVLWRNQNQSLFDISLKNTFNEWISTSRIYLRDWLWTTWEVCEKLISWLKSSMTYVWARDLDEYHEKAVIWVQTQSWYNEWTPHWNLIK
jgi:IMP dehydrogenase